MRLLIQRVASSKVTVDRQDVSHIGPGLLVLYAFSTKDTETIFPKVFDKIINLRIFPDDAHPINASVQDINGEILIVSQFTLYGDTRKGRRPSFIDAMDPDTAKEFDLKFVKAFKNVYPKVQTGAFREHMQVALVNDGPVTIWIDTDDWK